MRVAIAGGHGKVALHLERLCTDRGDEAVGLIRDPGHAADLEAVGAVAVVCDLEEVDAQELADAVEGSDAVVFAAGAGPGSGAARKDTVDRAAAALLADAAELAGVRRYLLVGSTGVDRPERLAADDVFGAYLRAKAASEEDLRRRNLDWTILRPGRLTDEPGTGRVHLAPSADRGDTDREDVPREDVARVLAALLDEPATSGLTLELVGGATPVAEAVAAASRPTRHP